ncbi:hypothetical protein [uncultured Flavobacterium sp.]|uniref:hypothetical protein n=1 Tax=uncultured Flavobacterium sp. TaxID=165435 RepID=UPI0025E367C4|nr:hypothetical protein [uncultured Flavobacterium sp.]
MIKTIKKAYSIFFIAALLGVATSCQPDETDSDNGLDGTADASFTIAPSTASPNRFRLEASNNNYLSSKWIIDGVPNTGYLGVPKDIFLPDAGDYVITHTVIGKGGVATSLSKDVTVTVSDPIAGNIVRDGKFPNGKGIWEVLNISPSGASWTFATGSATIKGTGSNQQGIYQSFEVVAGKQYAVDMRVQGSGATNTWFEVYVSTKPPVQGSDYSGNGEADKRISLNTWAGCGNSPFDGKLSEISCSGTGSRVTFSQSGTVYLVIKSGGENLGTTGITISNVEFRGVVE